MNQKQINIIEQAFDKNNIAVVFSSDNNYVPYLSVAIKSLIENSNKQNNYDIFVLDGGITEDNKYLVQLLIGDRKNISIRFVKIDDYIGDIDKNIFVIHSQFTIETYYRFFIPTIFKNFEKVIYLDADTVILADVAELYKIDLGENLLAATRDIDITRGLYTQRKVDNIDLIKYINVNLKIKKGFDYFQAGVLLLNVQEMIKHNMQDKFISKLIELKKPLYVDQDVLNSTCQGKVTFVDSSWDVLWHMYFCYPNLKNELKNEDYQKYQEAFEFPKIIHYTSNTKPWKAPEIKLAEHFWKYAKMTPYYEQIIFKNIPKKESSITKKECNKLIKIFGLFSYPALIMLSTGETKKKYKQKLRHIKGTILSK